MPKTTTTKPAPLPKTKISKWGFMLYLVYLADGSPYYVSIPE